MTLNIYNAHSKLDVMCSFILLRQ